MHGKHTCANHYCEMQCSNFTLDVTLTLCNVCWHRTCGSWYNSTSKNQVGLGLENMVATPGPTLVAQIFQGRVTNHLETLPKQDLGCPHIDTHYSLITCFSKLSFGTKMEKWGAYKTALMNLTTNLSVLKYEQYGGGLHLFWDTLYMIIMHSK